MPSSLVTPLHRSHRFYTTYAFLALLVLASCDRPPPTSTRQVIVYCSADAPVAQPVFDAFEKKTGIKVQAVFDTEATKTTGLVNRLLAEHERGGGGADVWWSSEPYGTIRLARAGALDPYTSKTELGEPGSVVQWPESLRGQNADWYAFAYRTRVIVYNTKIINDIRAPRCVRALAADWLRGRVGIARPQFGSTRGHFAELFASNPKDFEAWLRGLAANDVRLYDGNAAVARAVATGEVWVGLTDNDDAANGLRQGWPIASRPAAWFVPPPQPIFVLGSATEPPPAPLIPNTVAILRGARHRADAATLVDFLLSAEAQDMLAAGEACATPVSPYEFDNTVVNAIRPKQLEFIADHIDPAMKLCDEILKGR